MQHRVTPSCVVDAGVRYTGVQERGGNLADRQQHAANYWSTLRLASAGTSVGSYTAHLVAETVAASMGRAF
jgi:hypothetical protein